MNGTITVAYARKPTCIADVRESAFGLDAQKTVVIETKALSAEEYDALANDLMTCRDWLDGKGGDVNGVIQAIEVTAPDRETFYVNPEGHSNARYVGLRVEPSSTVKYPDVHVQLTGQNANSFNLLGICQRAARKAGVPDEDIKAFMHEATAGNYDQLLATCMRWFDCH